MNLVASSAPRHVESQSVDLSFWVEDAAPRLRYGNGKQTYRPEQLWVRWARQRKDAGAWSEWAYVAEIRGPRLRLDGSPSKAGTTRERIGSWMALADDELAATVEATRPPA